MFRFGDAIRQALKIKNQLLNIYWEDETERLPSDKKDHKEESPSILVRDEKIDTKVEGDEKVAGLGVPSKQKRIPSAKASPCAPEVALESADMLATPVTCQPLVVDPPSLFQGKAVIIENPCPKRMRIRTDRVDDDLEMLRSCLSLKVALESTDMLTTSVSVMRQPLPFSTRSSVIKISESKESGDVDSTKDNDTPQVSSDIVKNIESSNVQAVTVGVHSDGLSNLPIVNENLAGLSSTNVSGASRILQVGTEAQSSQGSHVEVPSLGYKELVESGSATSCASTAVIMSCGIDKGNPKSNVKGKRNSRTARYSNWCLASFKPSTVNAEPVASESLIAYCQSSPADHTINHKYLSLENNHWGVYDSVTGLFDVDLKVKVSSRPENVPYIYVVSKVNDKPICGHALNTEALDDGSCDDLISGSTSYIGSRDEEEDTSVHKVQTRLTRES